MLWIKAFHIIFMVTWFAGLFYLPRLFIYHTEAGDDQTGRERFRTMERRLLVMTHIGGSLTAIFGFWLLLMYRGDLVHAGWFQLKFLLVLGLVAYHAACVVHVRRFADEQNRHSSRYFRLFNELPSVVLIGIVLLAVLKPF